MKNKMLTVADLLKVLKDVPPETPIAVDDGYGYIHEVPIEVSFESMWKLKVDVYRVAQWYYEDDEERYDLSPGNELVWKGWVVFK